MEILGVIFSAPGATIAVCITAIIIVLIFIIFPERFKGVSLGYKDIKLDVPTAIPEKAAVKEAVEVAPPSSSTVLESPKQKDPPYSALWQAVRDQNRSGIETATEQMAENPPFGFTPQQFEIYGAKLLLQAGFRDGSEKLKEFEERLPEQPLASIYLAQYYCDIRSFEDANKHADIAEKKARLPKDKAAVFLVRANIIETSANKAAAAIYLKGKLPEIDSDKEKCELLVQIAKISDDPEAMVAYEHCLRLDPEAKNVRFSLALLYAKQKPLKFLAIRHYQALLRQDRLHSGASNNLALLYGEMDVASEEVRLLRQAAERDDGHATGNLALIYLRAGFTADAEKVLDSANPILATSERISAARQEIHRNSEAAKEKITELTAQSENLASAFAKFNFEELVATSNYVGRWVSDNETEGLEISARSLTVKIVHSSGQDKRYINSFGLSPITVAKASKDENLSNTLMSIMSGTDVVLLVGPAKIRVLDFDGSVLKKQIDFHRSAG